SMPYDADAQDVLSLGINNQLGKTISAVEGQRAAGGAPGELGDFNRDAFFLRFGFGQAAPGDFGVGEDDGRNDEFFRCAGFAGNDFNGVAGFAGSLVREQNAARDVANRKNVFVSG